MIYDFTSKLGLRGIARPTHFKVEFTGLPSAMANIRGTNEIIRDLSLFAETAEFPGTQLITQEIRYYDMPAKFVYGKAHDDLNITFRLDRDFQVKKLFDTWTNLMYNRNTGDVYYKNVYAGQFEIYQVMENGYSSYALSFDEIFPTQIGQISLGWDQSGQYSRLPVTFSFKRLRTIVNKRIFPKGSSDIIAQSPIANERTVDVGLNEYKTQLVSLQSEIPSSFRQAVAMNQTRMVNLSGFGNFGFI